MIILKRVILLMFLCLMLIAMFSVAYSNEEDPIIITHWGDVDLHRVFWEDAAATWNKSHPNEQIQIKSSIYPYDELHIKLIMAHQSGVGAPDLADIEIVKFSSFIKPKVPPMVELNDIIEPVKDKLVMGRIENYSKDGKYYGIDYHVGAVVMFYNKELLDKAGVNADDIKTWDDYIVAGKKVVAKTGKPMLPVDTLRHYAWYTLVLMQHSDLFDEDGNIIIDNEVNIKLLQFLKDMIYKDKIAVTMPGGHAHAEEFWTWMNNGECASLYMPLWYMGRFLAHMPDLKGKMIIRPLPVFPDSKKTAGLGGTSVSISTQCKHIELVKKFLAEALLSKEGSMKTWTILGFDPLRKDVWDDPVMLAPNEYTDYFGTDLVETVKNVVGDVGKINLAEDYAEVMALVQSNVMHRVLKEQSQTPEEALKEIAEKYR